MKSPAVRRREAPILGRLRARRIVDLYSMRVAPALAAALIGLGHLPDAEVAAALGLLALGANVALSRARFPFGLMPVARFAASVAAPVIAAAIVVPIAAYGGHQVTPAELAPSIVAATLTTGLGAWLKARFDASAELRVAVVGASADADVVAREIRSAGVSGYRVAGAIVPRGVASVDAAGVLGALVDLRSIVSRESLDLLVNASGERGEVFERASRDCLGQPVRILELSQFCEDVLGHVPAGSIDSGWFRYLMHPRFRGDAAPGKRLFDLAVGTGIALVVAPAVLALALAIRLADGGPAIYRQRRVGAGGREFTIVKLRTMTVGAQRVTSLGRFLRATHFDELPQLWNVLRGEMTLVGPRPERPGRVAELERRFRHYERRHLVKPGITGWAQVQCGYAGSETGTAWKLSHDLYYLKHRSLLADALLLVETVRAVGDGARRRAEQVERPFALGGASAGRIA